MVPKTIRSKRDFHEEEAHEILQDVEKLQPKTQLVSRIAARFKGLGLTEDLPEYRIPAHREVNLISIRRFF